MRRLSAFILIAALLAALVPSATLAGKPVPVVNTVTVTELNLQGPDLCALTVAITFTGRAQWAQFSAVKDGAVVSTPSQPLARTATTSAQTFEGVLLGANVWSWKVQLLDRKLKPIGAEVQTNAETHTGEVCPADGTRLAWYPY